LTKEKGLVLVVVLFKVMKINVTKGKFQMPLETRNIVRHFCLFLKLMDGESTVLERFLGVNIDDVLSCG
jgi:hypothetical protein